MVLCITHYNALLNSNNNALLMASLFQSTVPSPHPTCLQPHLKHSMSVSFSANFSSISCLSWVSSNSIQSTLCCSPSSCPSASLSVCVSSSSFSNFHLAFSSSWIEDSPRNNYSRSTISHGGGESKVFPRVNNVRCNCTSKMFIIIQESIKLIVKFIVGPIGLLISTMEIFTVQSHYTLLIATPQY